MPASRWRLFEKLHPLVTHKCPFANLDFLTLWKDADPDIPILIAAKSEYAKLK